MRPDVARITNDILKTIQRSAVFAKKTQQKNEWKHSSCGANGTGLCTFLQPLWTKEVVTRASAEIFGRDWRRWFPPRSRLPTWQWKIGHLQPMALNQREIWTLHCALLQHLFINSSTFADSLFSPWRGIYDTRHNASKVSQVVKRSSSELWGTSPVIQDPSLSVCSHHLCQKPSMKNNWVQHTQCCLPMKLMRNSQCCQLWARRQYDKILVHQLEIWNIFHKTN